MKDMELILDKYGDMDTYLTACRIREEEKANKRKPTADDIKETKELFADFGIHRVKIPKFPTYNALVRWRRDYIVKWLDEN